MSCPHLALLCTAAAALLATTPAQADSVDFIGYAHGSQAVGYTLAYPGSPGLNQSGSAGAGGFTTVLNNGPSFTSYCVDLYQSLSFSDPAYPEYGGVPGALHSFVNGNANADLGRLYAAHYPINDAQSEAAFQIAVWEISYETSNLYAVGDGTASFTGTAATLQLANTWLSSLGPNQVPVAVLESREHQDVVYAPVPEPETYALMLAGVGVVGWMTRRDRRHRA